MSELWGTRNHISVTLFLWTVCQSKVSPVFPRCWAARLHLRAWSPASVIQLPAWGLARASSFPANAWEGLKANFLIQRNIGSFLVLVVGLKKWPPKDVHILMSETVQCYLMWQECFTVTLQLMISSWRGDSSGQDVLSMPLRAGRQGSQIQKRRLGSVGSRGGKTFEDGGRSHQSITVGSPSPPDSPEAASPTGHAQTPVPGKQHIYAVLSL